MSVTPFALALHHARKCADFAVCTTAELASTELDLPLETCRAALRDAADAGHFRRLTAAGLGNQSVYQPTPKAGGLKGKAAVNCARELRAGLSPDATMRALLRGWVVFAGQPRVSFFDSEHVEFVIQSHSIRERGYPRALIGGPSKNAGLNVYIPVLKGENPLTIITTAGARWWNLLDEERSNFPGSRIHFIALPLVAKEMREAIARLKPPSNDQARAELSRIESEITADPNVVFRYGSRRAALLRQLDTATKPASGWDWIGSVLEATL